MNAQCCPSQSISFWLMKSRFYCNISGFVSSFNFKLMPVVFHLAINLKAVICKICNTCNNSNWSVFHKTRTKRLSSKPKQVSPFFLFLISRHIFLTIASDASGYCGPGARVRSYRAQNLERPERRNTERLNIDTETKEKILRKITNP